MGASEDPCLEWFRFMIRLGKLPRFRSQSYSICGLRDLGYTELSGGKFPKSISDWGEWAKLLAKSGVAKEKATTISGRLGTLLPYLTSMSKFDYDYTGAGKAVAGKRAIVFWYRDHEYHEWFKSYAETGGRDGKSFKPKLH